jgi:hypothetical protein
MLTVAYASTLKKKGCGFYSGKKNNKKLSCLYIQRSSTLNLCDAQL